VRQDLRSSGTGWAASAADLLLRCAASNLDSDQSSERTSFDLERTGTHSERTQFLNELELRPNVDLRKGDLAVRGWRVRKGALEEIARLRRSLNADDLELHLEQKGVDLRIGLDIARLALRQLVEVLVVVTGDSDMVPAFKFSRREGLRVLLDHLGGPVKRELKAHVDVVL
jgi:uncharacterized LabA/DUF88 family protein